nr:F0F1 ATP synthase subunit alpha [Bacillus paranthracis]
VSRVGGAAQTKIIKKLGGGIRLALAQYRELEACSQFASDLDEATRAQLNRGQRVTELLKQKQFSTLSVALMALSLYAADNGYLDNLEVSEVIPFESALHALAETKYSDVIAEINETGKYDADIADKLKIIVED